MTLSLGRERRSVLVTDAGSAQGLTVVRSLGRSGWRVVAAHPVPPDRIGQPIRGRSRWAERTVGTPDPELDGRAAGVALGDLARTEGVDLVFPISDKSILALLAHGRLDNRILALPDRSALELAWSKSSTAELAVALDIPTPRSISVSELVEAQDAVDQLGWPVVVKPDRSHDWEPDGSISTRAVAIVRDRTELAATLSSILSSGNVGPVLIQEYLPGHGIGVELLVSDGAPVVAFQHRRIHEVPLDGGMSAFRRAERPNPELLALASSLLAEVGWTGLAMVEFRMTPNGPVLMEINGRAWGSMALPVRAGVDFPLLAAQVHCGVPLTGSRNIDETVSCVNFELELRWMIAALGARLRRPRSHDIPIGEIARSAIRLVDPRTEFDVQEADDLRPSVAEAVGSLRRVGREGVGKLVGDLTDR